MISVLPQTIQEFRRAGESFSSELRSLKQRVSVADYGWYPYQTILCLPLVCDALEPAYADLLDAVSAFPVADIGCGDGDLSMFFASLGCQVDAIDHSATNFNQMRGLEVVRRELALPVSPHDIDLDEGFALPRHDYGLALFLGTLYHLKNPYYVLEKIAARADWCLLSTRIAQLTPGKKTHIEDEPVAYLLGAREANNDPTNYWIFSLAGLSRLAERAGWMISNCIRTGCSSGSDPVSPEADERVFLLLKSRTRHPEMRIRLLDGWYPIEEDAFRWTAKRFALVLMLPERAREFALQFFAPPAVLATGPLRLSCTIAGQTTGSITCDAPGTLELRGRFPSNETTIRLDFTIESNFRAGRDSRDLGICVPLLDPSQRAMQRIPLRVS